MSTGLAARRSALQSLAAVQRQQLQIALAPWRTPLAAADRTLILLATVRRQPLWLLLPALLVVVARPQHLLPWLQRGWMAWRVLKQIVR